MQTAIFILAILAAIAGLLFVSRNRSRKKLLDEFRRNWGKKPDRDHQFSQLAIYHETVKSQPAWQIISSDQIQDLNLHQVFRQLDRTVSKCGQQYLYHQLLTPVNHEAKLQLWDRAADFFTADAGVREKIQVALAEFQKSESYYLPRLIFDPPRKKPGYFSLIPFLLGLLLFSLVMLFFDPSYILLLIGTIVANFILYAINKKHTQEYVASFRSLNKLFAIAGMLFKLKLPIIDNQQLQQNLKAVGPLKKYLGIIGADLDKSSDLAMLGFLVIEYIKIMFLLDVIAFYSSLRHLRKLTENIHQLFQVTGFIDSSIALASFRKGLPYYSKPVFTQAAKGLEVEKIYHPLVDECIDNSLVIRDYGILITGSNMSGKTTFIRTLALNVLLAQTLYTCTAERYQAPFLQLYSSIVIADSLTDGKSYYFKELERILELIRASARPGQCLFIVDECFKGTNTIERIAAAREVLAYLNQAQHLVVMATHDIELAELLKSEYQLYHFNEVISRNTLSFDYIIKPGLLTSRNAIKLLGITGYPADLVERASQYAARYQGGLKLPENRGPEL